MPNKALSFAAFDDTIHPANARRAPGVSGTAENIKIQIKVSLID
jgi:hypothetical protein